MPRYVPRPGLDPPRMSMMFEPAVCAPVQLRDPMYIGVGPDYHVWIDERLLSLSAEELANADLGAYLGCPRDALGGAGQEAGHYLGCLGGRDCLVSSIEEQGTLPEYYRAVHPYQLLLVLDSHMFALVGRALQVMQWDRNHRHCGACGKLTQDCSTSGDRLRRCPACELDVYPRVSPCVIVLVMRGQELLLANGVGHPENMYSTVAGFVEPGESLEDCLHREVKEELSVSVHQLRYYGSQPWPFPHQLMVGFFAQYLDGDLEPNRSEINDARWWHYRSLPEFVPGSYSIAGQLISHAVSELARG